jgi:hypothetical protein
MANGVVPNLATPTRPGYITGTDRVKLTDAVTAKGAGADPTGVVAAQSVFATLAGAGTPIRVTDGTYKISANSTLTGHWSFEPGQATAMIKPAAGVAVTFAVRSFNAPPVQVFDLSAGGTVTFNPASNVEILPEWWGADPTGAANSYTALQAALNAASACQRTLKLRGNYRHDTALSIGSNTTIDGGDETFVSTLVPTGCKAFVIDATFRIKIQNIMIDGTNADATTGAEMKNVGYNVLLRNVYFYNSKSATVVDVNSCNHVVLDRVRVDGKTGAEKGLKCSNAATVFGNNLDLELLVTAVHNDGAVVTLTAPYVERAVTGINHENTASSTQCGTTVTGGVISSVNGFCLKVRADNFFLLGTALMPTEGGVPGGYGIDLNTANQFPNVVIRAASSGQHKLGDWSGNNLMAARWDGPQTEILSRNRFENHQFINPGTTKFFEFTYNGYVTALTITIMGKWNDGGTTRDYKRTYEVLLNSTTSSGLMLLSDNAGGGGAVTFAVTAPMASGVAAINVVSTDAAQQSCSMVVDVLHNAFGNNLHYVVRYPLVA